MCPTCGEGTLQPSKIETWMHQDDLWALFRNVPALVCDICGSQSFDEETAQRLADIVGLGPAAQPTSSIWSPVYDLAILDREGVAGEAGSSVSGTSHPELHIKRVDGIGAREIINEAGSKFGRIHAPLDVEMSTDGRPTSVVPVRPE